MLKLFRLATPFLYLSIFTLFILAGCDNNSNKQEPLNDWIENTATPAYDFEIMGVYPHNTHAYTEGLIYQDGILYESDGLYTQSKLSQLNLNNGQPNKQIALPANYFAEGIAIIGDHLYQLTYQTQIGFVYNKQTFQLEKTFHYPSEGWGLTTDGKELIMSDGSDTLNFIDPITFKVTHSLHVKDHQQPFNHLNELEFINGKIYANIYPTDIIAIISPTDGRITGWINIQKLNPCPQCEGVDQVANGIAYDVQNQNILVTGKNWPHVYAIKLKKSDPVNPNPALPSTS